MVKDLLTSIRVLVWVCLSYYQELYKSVLITVQPLPVQSYFRDNPDQEKKLYIFIKKIKIHMNVVMVNIFFVLSGLDHTIVLLAPTYSMLNTGESNIYICSQRYVEFYSCLNKSVNHKVNRHCNLPLYILALCMGTRSLT